MPYFANEGQIILFFYSFLVYLCIDVLCVQYLMRSSTDVRSCCVSKVCRSSSADQSPPVLCRTPKLAYPVGMKVSAVSLNSQTSCDPPSFQVSVSVGVLRCVCVCVVTGVGRGRPGGRDGDEHHRGSEEGAVENVRTR